MEINEGKYNTCYGTKFLIDKIYQNILFSNMKPGDQNIYNRENKTPDPIKFSLFTKPTNTNR